MFALLKLISPKDYIYGALIVVLIAGGLWYHHKLITEGIAEQQAKDDAATVAIVANTAKQTADLQARAIMAEQAYDKEIASIAAQPPVSVRLCNDSHLGSRIVPKAGTPITGNVGSGSIAGNIQPMPAGNSVGRDIGPMLELLAARADEVSATLREFQKR